METERASLPNTTITESDGLQPTPSFTNLQRFSTEAIRAGVHFEVARPAGQTSEGWQNQWSTLSLYVHTESTLEDIGKAQALTRERIRQIIKKATERLYEASPTEMQEQYPLEKIIFRKPLSTNSRLRVSDAHGGSLRTLLQAKSEGKSLLEIKEELQAQGKNVTNVIYNGRKRGIQIPYEKPAFSPEFKKQIESLKDPQTSNEQRQKVLDTVSLQYITDHSKDSDFPILKLSKLNAEAGMHFTPRGNGIIRIVELLKAAGVPARLIEQRTTNDNIHRYVIITSVDRDRVLQLLQEDPSLEDLRRNPVQSIGNATSAIPTSYELMNNDFLTLGNIMGRSITRKLSRAGLSYKNLLELDCPVAVFHFNGQLFINAKDREAVEEYISLKVDAILSNN